MRKKVLEIAVCPNHGTDGWTLYARELSRDGAVVRNVTHEQITDTDDVRTGLLLHRNCECVFPIEDFVLTLLSDEDAELNREHAFFQEALDFAPADFHSPVSRRLERLHAARETAAGKWNREEMSYYDSAVDSEQQREKSRRDIVQRPLWHIYIERERHLLSFAPDNGRFLEVGGGSCRTMRWLRPPERYRYEFYGTDISFKRLVVGKAANPQSEFVQCSAFNLPFRRDAFAVVISFSMMHHLPNPMAGIRSCMEVVAPDGLFLLQEPIDRPTLLPEHGWSWLKRLFQTYDHSEHDGKVDLTETLRLFGPPNWQLEHLHFSGSLLRTIVARLVGAMPALSQSRRAWATLIAMDRVFIKLFCRTPSQLGPKAVYGVWRRVVPAAVLTPAGHREEAFRA